MDRAKLRKWVEDQEDGAYSVEAPVHLSNEEASAWQSGRAGAFTEVRKKLDEPDPEAHPFPLVMTEIDLSQTTKHGGAGLEVGPQYLCLISGEMYAGTFSQQWYGLNFQGGPWGAGLQYDPPGTNLSGFQRIWRISNATEIAVQAEDAFAEGNRRWAIDHKLTHNGKPITEDAPVAAFGYDPKVSPIPGDTETDEDDL